MALLDHGLLLFFALVVRRGKNILVHLEIFELGKRIYRGLLRGIGIGVLRGSTLNLSFAQLVPLASL